jgi:hypothetical protein
MTHQRALGPKLFSLEEAEALLPVIRDRLARFHELSVRYDKLVKDLGVLRLMSSSGGSAGNPDVLALSDREQEVVDLLSGIRSVNEDLLDLGCVPKSLREGLIDFFALKEDRLVFLCWRQGEDRIRAWHTLEGGFQGRKPIRSFHAQDAPEETEEI